MITITVSAISTAGFSSISDIIATVASAKDLVADIAVGAIPAGPDSFFTFVIVTSR